MYYIEYFRPKPGIPYERFQRVVSAIYEEWKSFIPEDQLLLILGRTWRLGPEPPYIAIWRCKDMARVDAWGKVGLSPEVEAKMAEFMEVATVEDGGLYEDFGREQI